MRSVAAGQHPAREQDRLASSPGRDLRRGQGIKVHPAAGGRAGAVQIDGEDVEGWWVETRRA